MTTDLGSMGRRGMLVRGLFGLRALLVLVLAIGVGLGWIVHTARVQREAVATVERLGGQCRYEWDAQNRRPTPLALPGWRRWLIGVLGPDYVGSVTQVQLGVGSSGKDPAEDDLASIARLTRLEHLSILSTSSARRGLAQLRNLSRLKHLDLFGTDPKGEKEDLASLANLDGLEGLQLSLPWLDDADLAHLSGLTRLKQLSLNVPHSTVPGDGPLVTDAGLAALESLQDLRFLQISGSNKLTNAGLVHLAGLKRLEFLSLQGENVTSLEPLRPLVGLKSLTLMVTAIDKPSIDDAGSASLAGFLGLQTLAISGKSFTNAGLANLRSLPNLVHLNISGTGVDDVGVASLTEFPSLKRIFLSSTAVTDVGLAALAKKPGYAIIDLSFTKVSPEAIAAARSALPGTTIFPSNNAATMGVGFGSVTTSIVP